MIYEELEELLSNIFLARGKNVSDKVIKMWTKEILTRNLTDLAIKDAERELIEDDETDLTLPKVLAIMYRHNKKYLPKVEKQECKYCLGLNYVYNTLFFDKNGKYDDYRYALKCYHNDNEDKCAKMVLNEETHNRTEIKDGYVLVFTDITEEEKYLERVRANNWNDLWVKQEEPKGELVPFYPPKEEELVGENLVIPEPEEYVPDDEDVPF